MKGNRALLLLVIALIAGGLIIFSYYYFGREDKSAPSVKELEKKEDKGPLIPKEKEGKMVPIDESDAEQEPLAKKEGIVEEKTKNVYTLTTAEECENLKKDLKDFFSYLDKQDYIKEMNLEEKTFTRFKRLVRTLSSDPPIPAGEGLRHDTMIKNIYHLYRMLGLKNIKLVKSVLENESDTMEINLALFYKWLMSGDKCGREQGLPPSMDTLYKYAGFFVNTIGGRAYLFRRKPRLRLLIYYYSLLILHEANQKKVNRLGIDILSHLEPLAVEIENYEFLYFRKEYAGRLMELKNYYTKKRKG